MTAKPAREGGELTVLKNIQDKTKQVEGESQNDANYLNGENQKDFMEGCCYMWCSRLYPQSSLPKRYDGRTRSLLFLFKLMKTTQKVNAANLK